jgi:hypothetical protein
MVMGYILWAMRHPCGNVRMQTVAVCTVGDLGDGLGTAEDSGWVGALLRVGFSIGPNLQLWTIKVHLFYSERMAHGNLLILQDHVHTVKRS